MPLRSQQVSVHKNGLPLKEKMLMDCIYQATSNLYTQTLQAGAVFANALGSLTCSANDP